MLDLAKATEILETYFANATSEQFAADIQKFCPELFEEEPHDEDIDYSDIPPLTEEFFEKATLRIPAIQAHQLIQLDPDILQWFQAQGGEYKSLINSVLRRHIEQGDTRSAS
jgi:uncharacterized protein (DUF4415 family)